MLEIDRLKTKARAGEPLTSLEGLWLVEKVNQLRDALATLSAADCDRPEVAGVLRMLAAEAVPKALKDACVNVGETVYTRGNKNWEEWGLNPNAQPKLLKLVDLYEDELPMSRQQRRKAGR